MKITVLNGNPESGNSSFDSYVDELVSGLQNSGNEVSLYTARDMKISPCTGCFFCWVKTPGVCVFKDDAVDLCMSYINSDFVILASPIIMGFPSSLTKNAMDRLIPLIHPHLNEVNGEVHHLQRYNKYPDIAVVLEREEFTDEEDESIITDIFERASINVMSELRGIIFTEKDPQEAADEINLY